MSTLLDRFDLQGNIREDFSVFVMKKDRLVFREIRSTGVSEGGNEILYFDYLNVRNDKLYSCI